METPDESNLILTMLNKSNEDNSPLLFISQRLLGELKKVCTQGNHLLACFDQLEAAIKLHDIVIDQAHSLEEEVASLKEVHNAARELMLAFPGLHIALTTVKDDPS